VNKDQIDEIADAVARRIAGLKRADDALLEKIHDIAARFS